ncbi:MAG: hypothetical protein CYPHOPRED_001907 [Cyphobasidiales sp. Tagirdzhanova-0007]|nr:MAG: hypothetical protein CYPHOPRED_001907 [Cyphobasidiales sp. Tagirdzhanova-0007]
MSKNGELADPPNLTSVLYAQDVASLVYTCLSDPSLASFHTARFQNARRAAGVSMPRHEVMAQSCRNCSTLVVPGWTGRIRMQRRKPGQRRRSAESSALCGKNKLQWTCQCGWSYESSGSDPVTRSKYLKRKIVDKIAQGTSIQASADSLHPEPSSRQLVNISQSFATATAPHLASLPQSDSVLTAPSSRTAMPLSPNPSSSQSTISQPRRKRPKREGLQAMLQARCESERKRHPSYPASPALSSFGLSNFLQDSESK